MNFGNTYNQALLQGTAAPVLYQQMPYSPSYSVPIQPQPAPLPQTQMKVDNYESTRDKNVGDVIGGFFTGAGKAIYDMGHGLFFLGGVAGRALDHPFQTMGSVGGAVVHGVTHPLQTTQMVVTLPFAIAKGIVKPYSKALEQGKYGEALGRLAVDVTVIAAAMGDKPPTNTPPGPAPTPAPPVTPPPPTPTPVAPVTPPPPVATPVSAVPGGGNTVANQIKDVLLDQIGNSSGMTGSNNNITNNINIVIGGGIQGSSAAGTGGATLAKTIANADDVAKVVAQAENVAPVVNTATEVAGAGVTPVVQAAETAGTTVGTTAGAVASQSSTIGTKIGSGIDIIINAPGKAFSAVGEGIKRFGQGVQNVGDAILHPLETLKGLDPVKTTEAIANGIRRGGNAVADGLIFAAHNPKQAAIIAGAVGRGGKAAEDILMEMDLVR